MKNIENTNQITDKLNKTHLAVTVLEKGTGLAITKMPIYAEVSTKYIELPFKIQFLRDKYLYNVNSFWKDSFIEVNSLVNTLIAKYFPVEKIISTIPDNGEIRNLTKLGKALLEQTNDSIPYIITGNGSLITEYQEDKNILTEKLISFIVDFYKRNQKTSELEEFKDNSILQQYSYPLGFLATDHVGYVSYNIENVLQTIKSINHIGELKIDYLIYPLGLDANKISLSKLSLDNRITQEVVFAKLEIERPDFENDHTSLSLPSMQSPSLADWYMSAGSFASQPNTLLGADGCETLLPSNLSLHQYNFYQVVRATKQESNDYLRQVLPQQSPEVSSLIPSNLHLGYIDQYKTSWYSLGHSLGQILYSLPLAPGETVKLAVIDWSSETKKSRFEDTQTSEFLLHDTHRDRIITETVTASVDEWQRGGSVMGGISQLVGGAATMGPLAGAVGLGLSLGGGYATSSGDRDLRAENVQKLNDNFSQQSSVQRELNSTVVVQARQEEKESIQTRTFSNYNHSHTLTILYYEVLRHFRIVTEWTNRVPAILIKTDNSTEYGDKILGKYKVSSDGFLGLGSEHEELIETISVAKGIVVGSKFSDNDYILKHKSKLEDNLLNPEFADSLKAFERQKHREHFVKNFPKYKEKKKVFKLFNVEMTTGNIYDYGKVLAAIWTSPTSYYQLVKPSHENSLIPEGSSDYEKNWIYTNGAFIEGSQGNHNYKFYCYRKGFLGVTWEEMQTLVVRVESKKSGSGLSLKNIRFTGFDEYGVQEVLAEIDYSAGHLVMGQNGSVNIPLPINKAPLKIAISPEETEDLTKIEDLKAHLIANADYYDKIIQLNKSQYEIVKEFEASPQHDFLLDNVVPTPIAIHGSYIAYPLNSKMAVENPKLSEKDKKSERLITLPTRGVFAEGKLGHCNISEVIDNTRFWKWEEHPIPIQAPDINPVTPVTPTPQQITVEPSTVPTTINIQQPTPAPDPQGLAGALQAIVQGNMFRDMSMQAHVTDLLKNLNDNTAKIAQTAADMLKPVESKKKEDNSDTSGGGDSTQTGGKPSSTSGGSKESKPQQTEAQKKSDELDNDNKELEMAKNHFTPAQQAKIRQSKVDKALYKLKTIHLIFYNHDDSPLYQDFPEDGDVIIRSFDGVKRTDLKLFKEGDKCWLYDTNSNPFPPEGTIEVC